MQRDSCSTSDLVLSFGHSIFDLREICETVSRMQFSNIFKIRSFKNSLCSFLCVCVYILHFWYFVLFIFVAWYFCYISLLFGVFFICVFVLHTFSCFGGVSRFCFSWRVQFSLCALIVFLSFVFSLFVTFSFFFSVPALRPRAVTRLAVYRAPNFSLFSFEI